MTKRRDKEDGKKGTPPGGPDPLASVDRSEDMGDDDLDRALAEMELDQGGQSPREVFVIDADPREEPPTAPRKVPALRKESSIPPAPAAVEVRQADTPLIPPGGVDPGRPMPRMTLRGFAAVPAGTARRSSAPTPEVTVSPLRARPSQVPAATEAQGTRESQVAKGIAPAREAATTVSPAGAKGPGAASKVPEEEDWSFDFDEPETATPKSVKSPSEPDTRPVGVPPSASPAPSRSEAPRGASPGPSRSDAPRGASPGPSRGEAPRGVSPAPSRSEAPRGVSPGPSRSESARGSDPPAPARPLRSPSSVEAKAASPAEAQKSESRRLPTPGGSVPRPAAPVPGGRSHEGTPPSPPERVTVPAPQFGRTAPSRPAVPAPGFAGGAAPSRPAFPAPTPIPESWPLPTPLAPPLGNDTREDSPKSTALDTLGLIEEVQEKETPLEARERKLRERFDEGEYAAALELAEQLLKDWPASEIAARVQRSAGEILLQTYLVTLGSLDRVPALARSQQELRAASLDHREGFVLSQIDGVSTLSDILDVSGLPELEACRILCKLLSKGLISIR